MPGTQVSAPKSSSTIDPRIAGCMSMTPIDLITRYRGGLERFDPRVFELSDEQLDRAFLPDAGVGRWPARVLIGHLADAELSFVQRMRQTVAEDRPMLSPWDENAFIDSGLYGGGTLGVSGGSYPIAGFIAVIHTLRRWASGWLFTLDEATLDRVAMHPERGEMRVKTILSYSTWHLEHHAEFLNKKIEKMLGPRPAPEACETPEKQSGGCGAGCGCKGRN